LVGIQFELKTISEIGVETSNGHDLKSNEIPIKKGSERMIIKEIIIQLFLNFSIEYLKEKFIFIVYLFDQ
jgi:hypothetical protein